MSIATEITRLQAAKANLKTSIEAKGVTVSSEATLDTYPTLVDSIPSGGGSVTEKLVNFYDFDGTLIASYTGIEAQALTELPDVPSHSDNEVPLTFDGWNWTLSEIKNYNTTLPDVVINVGAIYYPTDGKTHLFFNITSDTDSSGVEFTISGYTSGDTVDWGDGNVENISGTTLRHVYTAIGEYDCALNGSLTSLTVGGSSTTRAGKREKLVRVYLSNTITGLASNGFNNCCSLESILIPNSLTGYGSNYTFNNCYSLKRIILNKTATGIGTSTFDGCVSLKMVILSDKIVSMAMMAFHGCRSLEYITIPDVTTTIGADCFNECNSLKKATLPVSVTELGGTAFYECFSLKSLVILGTLPYEPTFLTRCYSLESIEVPKGTTHIWGYYFSGCSSLQTVVIPADIVEIQNNAFYNCYSLSSITVLATTPPTLGGSALNSYLKKIYVPAESVEDYQTAWSTYASIIEAIPS